MSMKVYLGSDHRGVDFKAKVISILDKLGVESQDMGTNDPDVSCDYPVKAYAVASRVAQEEGSRGILICMSGIGQAIAANKVAGAYAALCYNAQAAKLSREHNNANILVISAKFVGVDELEEMIQNFLTTEFEGGRHQRRFDQVKMIEQGQEPQ